MVLNIHTIYFIACVGYVYLSAMAKILDVICTIISKKIYKRITGSLGDDIDDEAEEHSDVIKFLVNLLANSIGAITVLFADFCLRFLSIIYFSIPFIVFIVIVSIMNNNFEIVLKSVIQGYNLFIVDTQFFSLFKSSLWIFKISFEIVVPIYNWFVDSVTSGGMDIIKLFVQDNHHRSQLIDISSHAGEFFISIAISVSRWIHINAMECRHVNVLQSIRDSNKIQETWHNLDHRCFDYDYRDLDIRPSGLALQNIVSTVHALSVSLCPYISPLTAMLLYPVYDHNMSIILENAVNLLLSCLWNTWDITQNRCRLAYSLDLSKTLCAPDVFPLSRYVERMLEAVGELVDNWLNIAHMLVLSIFLDRDPKAMDSCRNDDYSLDKFIYHEIFAGRETRMIPATDSLLAITDGKNVIFFTKNTDTENTTVMDAFKEEIDIKYGVVSIDFASTILETDEQGDSKSAILGCRCVDDTSVGAIITCNTALFPSFFDSEDILFNPETRIPVMWEKKETALLVKCQYLRISLEPIVFPSQSAVLAGDEGGKRSSFNEFRECSLDPKKCNNVDAIIYVMPLCPKGGVERGVECILDSIYQTCFPYCVGLHQKGAGNSPIMLHSEQTLRDGVFVANSDCSVYTDASVPDLTIEYVSETTTKSSDQMYIQNISTTQIVRQQQQKNTACTFSNSHSVLIEKRNTVCKDNPKLAICQTRPPLQKSDDSLWTQKDFPVGTLTSAGQPFMFAGDVSLLQDCGLSSIDCEWTTSIHRIESDVHGQYKSVKKMTNIPSIRTDSMENKIHGGVIIPHDSMDVFGHRNPAAQTRSGVVYAVNPNLLPLRAYLKECSKSFVGSLGGTTEIICKNCYSSPRVFYTKPIYKCNTNPLYDVTMQSNQVRSCEADTTTEIIFEGADIFWSLNERAHACSIQNSGTLINLFIDDIVYIDFLNVAIAVKRGPIEELMFLTGLNTTAFPGNRKMVSRTVYYFLNLETMKKRINIPWKKSFSQISNERYSMLCQNDYIVPPFGSFVALTTMMTVRTVRIVVNSYVINIFGILEGMISRVPICNGRSLNHYALDNCNEHPLSVAPLYYLLMRINRLYDIIVYKSVRYMGTIFGIPTSSQRIIDRAIIGIAGKDSAFTSGVVTGITDGIGAGVSVLASSIFGSVYGIFFIFDEIILKFIQAQLQKDFMANTDLENSYEARQFWFFGFSNVVFDSITTGKMKTHLFAPQHKICQIYAQMTGMPSSPISKVLFHSCMATFEGVYAGIQVISASITLGSISDCICNINQYESQNTRILEERCRYKLPNTLLPELLAFMYAKQENSRQTGICSIMVNKFKDVLLEIPTQTKIHVDIALRESINVPTQLVSFLNIPGLSSMSCTDYSNNLEVMTIITRPIGVYAKCAMTANCRQKCQREIDWFYKARFNTPKPNRPALHGDLMTFIPAWKSSSEIRGMGTNIFEPLAVQDYGPRYSCTRYIVVIGRQLEIRSVNDRPWTLYGFCYMVNGAETDNSMTLLSSSELPETAKFCLRSDNNKDGRYEVNEIFLVPIGETSRGTMVLVLSDLEGVGNIIFETYIDSSLQIHSEYMLYSQSVTNDETCNGITNAIYTNCEKLSPEMLATQTETVIGKIIILPDTQPPKSTEQGAIYTIMGILESVVEFYGDDTSITRRCIAKLEFVIHRYESLDTAIHRAQMCNVFSPDLETADTRTQGIYELINTRLNTGNSVILSTSGPKKILLFTKLKEQVDLSFPHKTEIQEIQFYRDENRRNYHYNFSKNIQSFSDQSAFMNTQVSSRSFSYDRFSNLVDRSTVYSGVILNNIPDNSEYTSTINFSVMQCSRRIMTSVKNWITEFAFSFQSVKDQTRFRQQSLAGKGEDMILNLQKQNGIITNVDVTIELTCDYMACESCTTQELRDFCNAAKECATVNCIGTVINPSSLVCVVGSLIKEVKELSTSNTDAYWFAIVEIGMGILLMSKESDLKQTLNLESITNIVIVDFCETKDVIVALSALFPSLFFTIYTAFAGGAQEWSLSDIGNDDKKSVTQLFVPATRLKNTFAISAVTELLNSVLQIYLVYVYKVGWVIICGTNKLAEFTGGFVNVIEYESSICNIGDDISFGASAKTDQELIIQKLQTLSTGASHMNVRLNGNKISATSFMVDMTNSIFWLTQQARIFWITIFQLVIDWVVGVIYGLSKVSRIIEPDTCHPAPVDTSQVMNCVCGDEGYVIHTSRRNHNIIDGALWCTGILKMVNVHGITVYVYNPYTMQELSHLHYIGIEYLNCIGKDNQNFCDAKYPALFTENYDEYFHANGVSPLAVLAQCRRNFHDKTWDAGAFAAFNIELAELISTNSQISALHMKKVADDILLYLGVTNNNAEQNSVTNCLALGPAKNDIKSCMFLAFAHQSLSQEEDYESYLDYFSYEKHTTIKTTITTQTASNYRSGSRPVYRSTGSGFGRAAAVGAFLDFGILMYEYLNEDGEEIVEIQTESVEATIPGAGPDACGFLSSMAPEFTANANIILCRDDSSDFSVCSTQQIVGENKQCRIAMTTFSDEQAIHSNVVKLFRVSNTLNTEEVSVIDKKVKQKYTTIQGCIDSFFDEVKTLLEPQIPTILKTLDLELVSSEGDLIHQYVDCIFMGAYPKVVMLPADNDDILQNLMYSRDKNGYTREFELPCWGNTVYDSHLEIDTTNAVIDENTGILQKTCGSEARISLMAYVIEKITNNDKNNLNTMLAVKVQERFEAIRTNISNIQKYGCKGGGSWQNCCQTPGSCLPGESSFESDLPEVNFQISAAELLNMLRENILNLQRDALYDIDVSLSRLYRMQYNFIKYRPMHVYYEQFFFSHIASQSGLLISLTEHGCLSRHSIISFIPFFCNSVLSTHNSSNITCNCLAIFSMIVLFEISYLSIGLIDGGQILPRFSTFQLWSKSDSLYSMCLRCFSFSLS